MNPVALATSVELSGSGNTYSATVLLMYHGRQIARGTGTAETMAEAIGAAVAVVEAKYNHLCRQWMKVFEVVKDFNLDAALFVRCRLGEYVEMRTTTKEETKHVSVPRPE